MLPNPSATARVRERHEPRAGVLGAGLLASLLYGVGIRLPLLVPFPVIAGFPLLVVRLRNGLAAAAAATVFAAAVLGAVFTPAASAAFLMLVVPTLLIAEAMARGRGLMRGCAWAFSALTMEILLALLFANPTMEAMALGPLEYLRSPGFLAEMRPSTAEAQIEQWAESVTAFHEAMQVVYPAAYVIMAALIVIANAALLRGYLLRRDPGWLEGGEFESVRWPFALAVSFVLAGLSVLSPPLRPFGYNVLLVVCFFFALQGLAVVAYYAQRLAAPPLMRWAVVVLVVINPWAPQILGLIGLLDMWFDFRKYAEPEQHARPS